MRERPVLMNGEMVRALLEDRKGMTRRVIKPQPGLGSPGLLTGLLMWDGYDMLWRDQYSSQQFKCPYGVPGDRLWVRETHRFTLAGKPKPPGYVDLVEYKADGSIGEIKNGLVKDVSFRWRPSIHMPRWASRILLEVTEVRVERVQEITEEDAKAEGICITNHGMFSSTPVDPENFMTATMAFIKLWDSINFIRGFGWREANPWVWVVTFKRVEV